MLEKQGYVTNWSIIIAAVLSHSLFVLSEQVLYHFFSDPSNKNDQRPQGNLRACLEALIEILNTFLCVSVFSPCNVNKH